MPVIVPRLVDRRSVDSILRAALLVEERMGEDMGVRDMADAACYSPFYFSRIFAEGTGHSPYDYLMRRRVASAAARVVSGEGSLTEIALDHGFEVQEGFARAFRRCFGLLPSEARERGRYPVPIARTMIGAPYVEAMLSGAVRRPTRVPVSVVPFEAREAARFEIPDDGGDIAWTREFAYRAWLPAQGRTEPPPFEILEIDPVDGSPAALLLPI
jgi:AraC-like DNA-binding protein